MALILSGKTECPLCGRVLSEADELVAFPAFLPREHPLWRYSDAGFHRDCYTAWEYSDEMSSLYEQFRRLYDERPMPPDQVEDFQDWYDRSDEVRVWERRMQEFTATIVSKGRAQEVDAPDNKAAGAP